MKKIKQNGWLKDCTDRENSATTKLIEKFDGNSKSSDGEEILTKEQLPPNLFTL